MPRGCLGGRGCRHARMAHSDRRPVQGSTHHQYAESVGPRWPHDRGPRHHSSDRLPQRRTTRPRRPLEASPRCRPFRMHRLWRQVFFEVEAHPERARRVLFFFPRTLAWEDDETLARSQMSLVLLWALIPWKAQGVPWEKLVVKIGSAASRSGVAFFTLTRCTHPDGLAIDDNFPVTSTVQKQKRHKLFVKRQEWERRARATFSATIRRHTRDPAVYREDLVWSEEEVHAANAHLETLAQHRQAYDTDVVELCLSDAGAEGVWDPHLMAYVWSRMCTQYPTCSQSQQRGNHSKP